MEKHLLRNGRVIMQPSAPKPCSYSAQAASRTLNIHPGLLYQWQRAAQATLPVDPAEAAEVRALRTANKRLV